MKLAAISLVSCALVLAIVGWRWQAGSDLARELGSIPPVQAAETPVAAQSGNVQALPTEARRSVAPAPPQAPAPSQTAAQGSGSSSPLEPATLVVRVVDPRTAKGIAAQLVSIDSRARSKEKTDLEGRATFRLPPNVEWRVRVRSGGSYLSLYEQRTVPPLAPGECRELVVEAALMERQSFFARVLDAETRQPVAAAMVFAPGEAAPIAASDVDGIFDVPTAEQRPTNMCIRAQGYADLRLGARSDCGSRAQALEVLLARGAVLTVRLEGLPVDAWTRYVVSCTEAFQSYGSAPQLLRDASGGGSFPQRLPCDAQGLVRFESLPPDQALVVRISRDGQPLPLRLPSLQLAPGESRELRVALDDGCRLRGRTLDPRGVPVGKVAVWLMPLVRDGAPVAQIRDWERASARVMSDDKGAFSIEGVAPGAWQLAPAGGVSEFDGEVRLGGSGGGFELPDSFARRGLAATTATGERNDVAPRIQNLVVPPGARILDVDLIVYCGRFIQGRVVGVDGKAIAGVDVFACEGGIQADAVTDSWGKFLLGPLGPGDFQVWARDAIPSRRFAVPQAASAGDRDVVLVLQSGGNLLLSYPDATSPARFAVFLGTIQVKHGILPRGVGESLALPAGRLLIEVESGRSARRLVREIDLTAGAVLDLVLRDGD